MNEHIAWEKPRCLLISGASGLGKTHLAHLINEIANRTMVTIDSKTLSEVGYIGKDPSTMFEGIFRATSGNLSQVQADVIILFVSSKFCNNPCIEKIHKKRFMPFLNGIHPHCDPLLLSTHQLCF